MKVGFGPILSPFNHYCGPTLRCIRGRLGTHGRIPRINRFLQSAVSLGIGGHDSAVVKVAEIGRTIGREELDARLLRSRGKGVRAEETSLKPRLPPEVDLGRQR